jgi:hypothetical protein
MQTCVYKFTITGTGILTRFPFDIRREARGSTSMIQGISQYLRIDSPTFNYCSRGTLLHFSHQDSHLIICYCHQDLHRWKLQLGLRPKPSTLTTATHLLVEARRTKRTSQQRLGLGPPLKRHPFSGLIDSAGELLHTP